MPEGTRIIRMNILILSTYLVSQFILLSILAKIIDAKHVMIWMSKNLKFIKSKKVLRIVFMILLSLEFCALTLVLLFGTQASLFTLIFAVALYAVALLFAKTIGNGHECPCFGLASMLTKYNSKNIFKAIALLVSLFYIAHFFDFKLAPATFCLILDLFGASIFYMELSKQRLMIYGVPVRSRPLLPWNAKNNNKPFVVIFLSLDCPACMSFMQYLEKFTKFYAGTIDFMLIVNGLNITEDVKYGEAIISASLGEALKSAFDIKNTPTMVTATAANRHVKLVGLDACLLGIQKIIVGAQAKSAVHPTSPVLDG